MIDVLVVKIRGTTVTVEQPDGSTAGIDISTLVDADCEQGRRRFGRRLGYVVDAVGTFFR